MFSRTGKKARNRNTIARATNKFKDLNLVDAVTWKKFAEKVKKMFLEAASSNSTVGRIIEQ